MVYMYTQRLETGSVPHSYRACLGNGPVDARLVCMDATQQWLGGALKKNPIPKTPLN